MSYATINGKDIAEGRFTFPICGAWHADLVVDAQESISGSVTIDWDGALSLRGMVLYGGVYTEILRLRVIGGKGGWLSPCSPKFYQGAALGTIAADILAAAAESLSATSDAAVKSIVPPSFCTTSASVGANLRTLMTYAPAGTSWRYLSDGTFWIGNETWPAFAEAYDAEVTNPLERRVDIGGIHPTVLPGQTLETSAGTVRVNRVESSVSARSLRARAWWQS